MLLYPEGEPCLYVQYVCYCVDNDSYGYDTYIYLVRPTGSADRRCNMYFIDICVFYREQVAVVVVDGVISHHLITGMCASHVHTCRCAKTIPTSAWLH